VNKADLIEAVANRLGHSKRDVTDIVEAFLEETKKAVATSPLLRPGGLASISAR